ncbi:MAG TPA: tripartite tricarboxylate transporter permease [Hyphomicrobiaceae bacterium]|jgi:TctA family transporter|nr:tripartite tricarboxylate transporter permease [Hyphomicrobiaceae bacterium]
MAGDLLGSLALGLATAASVQNLLYCFLGVLLGTLIGVLPGIGPVATIAMLLPITYALPPTAALIMLAGIYYGAQYGGSTTAILVNLPGEASSVVTCIDGYQMARQGRAGPALAMAAIASFAAGTVATLICALLAAPLAMVATQFGPAEYFSLMVLGLVGAVVIAHRSILKAVGMVIVGLILGLVGTDVNTGTQRFTFGVTDLFDGIGFIVVAVGVFAIAEIVTNLERKENREVFTDKVGSLMPSRDDLERSALPIARGTLVGSVLGILPAGGALIASFAAYAVEKRAAKDPSRFGKGAIEGVVGPEAANNAGAQTSFIPMLTLGIPPNVVMALMIGGMMIHNIQPGPQVMTKNPELFWGLIASMWLGNLMLVVLNLPLVGIWVRLLSLPYRFLYPAIILFCCIGVYTLSNNTVDVALVVLFGALGYLLVRLDCEPAPMLLGFILGPMMEEFFRRALIIERGDFMVFLNRPISACLLAAALLVLASMSLPAIMAWRRRAIAQ